MRRLTLKLTRLEAEMLFRAAGQTMDWSDAREATFRGGREQAAATRAFDKLTRYMNDLAKEEREAKKPTIERSE